MEKMNLVRSTLRNDPRGANLVEYVVLTGAVGLAGAAGARKLSSSVTQKMEDQGAQLSGVEGGGAAQGTTAPSPQAQSPQQFRTTIEHTAQP